MSQVGLENKLHSRCDELSGGQQQEYLLYRTLFQEATVILADEPVASLDPVTSRRFYLKNINGGITVIVNILTQSGLQRHCDIALQDVRLVFEGTPKD